MRVTAFRLSLTSLLLAAAAAPALAGNYAEGDPRPAARTSEVPSAAVAADTRTWLAAAPTVGYPEGNPQAISQVSQKTRVAVRSEAVAWVRSGMSQLAYANAPSDSRGPSYARAAQVFEAMRQGDATANAQSLVPPPNANAIAR